MQTLQTGYTLTLLALQLKKGCENIFKIESGRRRPSFMEPFHVFLVGGRR